MQKSIQYKIEISLKRVLLRNHARKLTRPLSPISFERKNQTSSPSERLPTINKINLAYLNYLFPFYPSPGTVHFFRHQRQPIHN